MSLEELRSVRIPFPGTDNGIAAFDTLGTIAVSLLIAKQFDICPVKVVITAVVIGEIAHIASGVPTPITKILS